MSSYTINKRCQSQEALEGWILLTNSDIEPVVKVWYQCNCGVLSNLSRNTPNVPDIYTTSNIGIKVKTVDEGSLVSQEIVRCVTKV